MPSALVKNTQKPFAGIAVGQPTPFVGRKNIPKLPPLPCTPSCKSIPSSSVTVTRPPLSKAFHCWFCVTDCVNSYVPVAKESEAKRISVSVRAAVAVLPYPFSNFTDTGVNACAVVNSYPVSVTLFADTG